MATNFTIVALWLFVTLPEKSDAELALPPCRLLFGMVKAINNYMFPSETLFSHQQFPLGTGLHSISFIVLLLTSVMSLRICVEIMLFILKYSCLECDVSIWSNHIAPLNDFLFFEYWQYGWESNFSDGDVIAVGEAWFPPIRLNVFARGLCYISREIIC